MIGFVPGSPLTRGGARRRYLRINAQVKALLRGLDKAGQPMDRYVLIDRWARLTGELAALHLRVYGELPVLSADMGGGDTAASLEATAGLLRLVASTELSVALSEWAYADELKADGRIWHQGWVQISSVTCVQARGSVRVEFDGGRDRVIFETRELVRVGGPDRFEVVELARDMGADFTEAREWYWLANIAGHDHRAAMLSQLSDQVVARVGELPAGVLMDLAETEGRLAADERRGA
jgi:hypothetical protein